VEVILLEKMRNLGALGDLVNVKPGFARNYLVPQGKAVYANKANREKFEQHRAELEKVEAEKHQKALERQAAINALPPFTITMKASEEGKLFGSVGVRDVNELLTQSGIEVEKREISLPADGVLRTVGEYDISVDLESDLIATIKVIITPEG